MKVTDPITNYNYEAEDLLCCHVECFVPAEYAIIATTGHPNDYTHSCSDHIGNLLGTVTDQASSEFHYELVPIAPVHNGKEKFRVLGEGVVEQLVEILEGKENA